MKKTFFALFAAISASVCAAESSDGEDVDFSYIEYGYERWYVGAGAQAAIPQGGGNMRSLAGAAARIGWYADDFLAVEASAAWLEHDAGLGVRCLWHWWGFERFDPFFTFGADGWIDGDVGPSLGCGAFWHLGELWSLRFDATATLGLDGDPGMVYGLGVGIQYAF
ncbi:MAG: hypothetical protein K6F50_08115 [Kiritimatiellae bacterium]|nr:hypothetical protein [Kiritimatiellia bacterium]